LNPVFSRQTGKAGKREKKYCKNYAKDSNLHANASAGRRMRVIAAIFLPLFRAAKRWLGSARRDLPGASGSFPTLSPRPTKAEHNVTHIAGQ
jgi:hypothetical protein